MSAPFRMAAVTAAAVPSTRSLGFSTPVILPVKCLRETPTQTGQPRPLNSPRWRIRRRLSSTLLPNPIPGSTTIRSRDTPADTAFPIRSSRK